MPSLMKSSTVFMPLGARCPPVACSGRSRMYMRFSGMPLLLAALRAVSSSGTHVNRAFAPQFFSWYSSSAALYAALAGDWRPPRRCVAHASGRVSIFQNHQHHDGAYILLACAYRVQRKDCDDLVPLGALVRMETQLLRQTAREPIDALLDVDARVRLARQAAGKRVVRVAQRMSAIVLVQQEVTDGERVWRVKRQLRHP